MHRFTRLCLLVLLCALAGYATAEPPLLVVLTETGSVKDGLPVLAPHPDGKRVAAQLDRGLAGDLLRVYRHLQTRLHRTHGKPVEPAYLLLSTNQGGFARYGFWLGGQKKPDAAYVDVHRDWELSGRFGAVDQIFPHELGHAIFHQLGIEPPDSGGANQVHAVGVRTDRFTAFNEGFAEHFQVMAVDHPLAAPETRALAKARDLDLAAQSHLERYRRELSSSFAPATRMRIGFPLWYSNDERVLRYFAVKRNDFAREPSIPEHLLTRPDRLEAYLLENTLPGNATGALKPLERLIVHEGALSAFFFHWATNDALRQIRQNAAFYETFGTTAEAVTPLQNVYLKLFHVLEVRKPRDASTLAAAYRALFPDEAVALDAVVAEAFHTRSLDVPPEIWVVNADFRTGTTVFDQFRGAPRAHTFDLNAASIVDLTTVPGVTPALARKIAVSGPYASIEALASVPGVTPELLGRFRTMARGMDALRAADEESLSMQQIFVPFLGRAGIAFLLAWAACGVVYAAVRRRGPRRPSMVRILASGFGAAFVGIAASWISGNPVLPLLAVVILFGLPAAAWQFSRHRSLRPAMTAIGVWVATVVPAILVTTPWVR